MDNNPDSPDSLASDQLTVDLLSPRAKRRRPDVDHRDGTPDVSKNNNNDVAFVLMEGDPHENGADDDDEVCIFFFTSLAFSRRQVGNAAYPAGGFPS